MTLDSDNEDIKIQSKTKADVDSGIDAVLKFMKNQAKGKDGKAGDKGNNKFRNKYEQQKEEDRIEQEQELEKVKKISQQKHKLDFRAYLQLLKEISFKYILISTVIAITVIAMIKIMPVIAKFFGSGIHNIFKFLFRN